MKKQAQEIKKGDKIVLSGKECVVGDVEVSDIGKHGKRKVRIVAITPDKEKVIVIRPEDYPLEIL